MVAIMVFILEEILDATELAVPYIRDLFA